MTTDLKKSIIDSFLPFKPERIILFGSHARGDTDPTSDIDIIIVYQTDKSFMDRLEELYLAWNIPTAIDILAYTPDEYQAMKAGSAFIQDISKEGILLYEGR